LPIHFIFPCLEELHFCLLLVPTTKCVIPIMGSSDTVVHQRDMLIST